MVSSYENLLDSTVMCKIYGWRRKWGFGGFFPQHNGRRHGNSRIVCVCAHQEIHTQNYCSDERLTTIVSVEEFLRSLLSSNAENAKYLSAVSVIGEKDGFS